MSSQSNQWRSKRSSLVPGFWDRVNSHAQYGYHLSIQNDTPYTQNEVCQAISTLQEFYGIEYANLSPLDKQTAVARHLFSLRSNSTYAPFATTAAAASAVRKNTNHGTKNNVTHMHQQIKSTYNSTYTNTNNVDGGFGMGITSVKSTHSRITPRTNSLPQTTSTLPTTKKDTSLGSSKRDGLSRNSTVTDTHGIDSTSLPKRRRRRRYGGGSSINQTSPFPMATGALGKAITGGSGNKKKKAHTGSERDSSPMKGITSTDDAMNSKLPPVKSPDRPDRPDHRRALSTLTSPSPNSPNLRSLRSKSTARKSTTRKNLGMGLLENGEEEDGYTVAAAAAASKPKSTSTKSKSTSTSTKSKSKSKAKLKSKASIYVDSDDDDSDYDADVDNALYYWQEDDTPLKKRSGKKGDKKKNDWHLAPLPKSETADIMLNILADSKFGKAHKPADGPVIKFNPPSGVASKESLCDLQYSLSKYKSDLQCQAKGHRPLQSCQGDCEDEQKMWRAIHWGEDKNGVDPGQFVPHDVPNKKAKCTKCLHLITMKRHMTDDFGDFYTSVTTTQHALKHCKGVPDEDPEHCPKCLTPWNELAGCAGTSADAMSIRSGHKSNCMSTEEWDEKVAWVREYHEAFPEEKEKIHGTNKGGVGIKPTSFVKKKKEIRKRFEGTDFPWEDYCNTSICAAHYKFIRRNTGVSNESDRTSARGHRKEQLIELGYTPELGFKY